jgi:signal transduction histidine kinase
MIVVEDTSVDPRIVYPQEALNEGIRSIISLPLVHREKVIGDLRLYAENPRRYSKDDISFLKILAGGTAVVINDSRVLHQLKDASRKTVFFANKLSHDLRAPVHAVQSMLAVMDKGYAGDLTEKQKEITSRSIKRLEQLLLLIKNILCLAESRSADNKQQLVPVRLNEIAADSFHLFKVLFEQKKIMTHFATSPAPIVFKEMAGDFQRLFSNLLENALRYTPKGGRVEMEVTQDAKNISIRISDSGIGIAPEHIEKIFDDFFRSAEARKFVQDGNGLGLPTVKSIVTRYNGFINVESEQAKGTTFFITLPKQD